MFCSECGEEADGRFCWNCGSKLREGASVNRTMSSTTTSSATVTLPTKLWHQEINYDTLIKLPEVKDKLAMQTVKGRKISAEEFVEFFPKSMQIGAGLGQAFGSMLGFKTGKSHTDTLIRPCGVVLVAALCYLTRSRFSISTVRQGVNAVAVTSDIPSDLWSWKGELEIIVTKDGGNTKVHAATNIPGQKYDWGKSKRILEKLFTALRQE
ncbi:hypothetical protein QWA68_015020 [Fusarium oxysporum]|nr:hypothetical protein QWA68_015020 [Fusarium oxysporum]